MRRSMVIPSEADRVSLAAVQSPSGVCLLPPIKK
jgi:hypothetical protein